MKNLLVVGDSFMSADRWNPKYAGKHWTEKCTKYNIYNLAFPGYSNYNIVSNIHLALEKRLRFDYLLIWFTDHRLTFPNPVKNSWLGDTVTNCTTEYLTSDQNLAQKYYFTEVPDKFITEQTAYEILGTVSWLKNKNFKFLFNFGQYQGFKYLRNKSSIYNELLEFKESKYYFPEIDINHYINAGNKLIIDSKLGPSYHTKEFWQDHISTCVEKKFQEVYGE